MVDSILTLYLHMYNNRKVDWLSINVSNHIDT